jgi:hypothetical protein
MTPGQRLARALDLSRASRQMAEARVRKKYPGASEREVKLRLASLVLDRQTMIRAFSWDPAKEGR